MSTVWIDAIKKRDLKKITSLIEEGENVNVGNNEATFKNRTPLHHAIFILAIIPKRERSWLSSF